MKHLWLFRIAQETTKLASELQDHIDSSLQQVLEKKVFLRKAEGRVFTIPSCLWFRDVFLFFILYFILHYRGPHLMTHLPVIFWDSKKGLRNWVSVFTSSIVMGSIIVLCERNRFWNTNAVGQHSLAEASKTIQTLRMWSPPAPILFFVAIPISILILTSAHKKV